LGVEGVEAEAVEAVLTGVAVFFGFSAVVEAEVAAVATAGVLVGVWAGKPLETTGAGSGATAKEEEREVSMPEALAPMRLITKSVLARSPPRKFMRLPKRSMIYSISEAPRNRTKRD
jgi:hypothetical protein